MIEIVDIRRRRHGRHTCTPRAARASRRAARSLALDLLITVRPAPGGKARAFVAYLIWGQ